MPFDKVDPKDIAANLKVAREMEQQLETARKAKADVLRLFDATMKDLKKSEDELASLVKTAFDRCKYQDALKKQIESGKIDPKNEKDVNRRVKEFIDVVEKQDQPRFEKELKEFDKLLDDLRKILK
jgi:hypothetical protein